MAPVNCSGESRKTDSSTVPQMCKDARMPKYWGKGFATEAARGSLRVGFEQLGLTEIVSFTSAINLRSRAVMVKLGMRETEEIFEHPSVPVGSTLRQHCLYRLSHLQWVAKAI
mgnify:CR=1 FL=1